MNKSAQPDEGNDLSQATPGVDYLCFDLYMRMRNPRKIFIKDTSNLAPLDSVLTWDGDSSASSNPSTYGNFSKDCMIGATRFSVYDDTAENKEKVSKLKWITRPDLYLLQDGTNYSVLTGLKSGNQYNTYTHSYWQVTEDDGTQKKALTVDKNFVASTTTEQGNVLLGKNAEIANLKDVKKAQTVTTTLMWW